MVDADSASTASAFLFGESMSEISGVLSAIEQADPKAAQQLLPLVYDELRKLAAQKLAHEVPGRCETGL